MSPRPRLPTTMIMWPNPDGKARYPNPVRGGGPPATSSPAATPRIFRSLVDEVARLAASFPSAAQSPVAPPFPPRPRLFFADVVALLAAASVADVTIFVVVVPLRAGIGVASRNNWSTRSNTTRHRMISGPRLEILILLPLAPPLSWTMTTIGRWRSRGPTLTFLAFFLDMAPWRFFEKQKSCSVSKSTVQTITGVKLIDCDA